MVTSTRTVANPRWGQIYEPLGLAAGVPIWFHPMVDGRYLALFKSRWVEATSVYSSGSDLFSAHTESTLPSYALIDPATGNCDGPYPMIGTPLVCTFNAAFSRGEFIFIVGTHGGDPWLWHYRITTSGQLILQGDEAAPEGYNLGVYATGNDVWVFGEVGGTLARAKKNWGRIGVNTDAQHQWTYEGDRGWYLDPTEATAMVTKDGEGIPADGPCSVAKFRDRYYLSATSHVSGIYGGHVYTSRDVDTVWKSYDEPTQLGADANYLGGAVYLQPQLVVNKDLVHDGAASGFAYVSSHKVTVSSNSGILTAWGMLMV